MERGTFLKRPVQKEFGNFVEVLLHTDGGDANRANRDFQRERFETVALPLYVVLDPSGEKVLWQGGVIFSADEFAEKLRTARKSLEADS